jgi:hypothetical protein
MHSEPLDVVPLWTLPPTLGLLAWLALDAGYRFGKWWQAHASKEKDNPLGAMVTAILGLLAFMLAFTFGMAASRYDLRRQLVLDEANAISTTYLRVRLLPEPERSETARLLREYVDIRVRGIQDQNVAESIARSQAMHEQLWSQAVAAADKSPGSMLVALFVESLNELIDLHAKRVTIGARSRIPISIWVGLFTLAILGMASIGYHSGLSAARRSPAMLVLVFAFAGVLFLIVDLDRGYEGLLRVSQQATIDVQQSMRSISPQ